MAARVSSCSLRRKRTRREILLGGQEGAELEAAARRVAELLRRLDHFLAMDGVRLDGDDDAPADVIVPDVGEDDFLDDGALVAQHAHRLVHALRHVGRQAAFVPGAGERDAHALDRTVRGGAVVDLGRLGRGLVVGIVARQHVEHQRVVFDRPGERARGVEAERQREDAAAADQAVGRLDAGGAAEARRIADRAAGVGAHGAHAERGGDGRARAARRAAGLVVGVPGIARRREGLVGRHRAVGEFVGGELAQDDRAACFQAPHGLGVDRRHVVGAQVRMAGRQHALGLVDVLQRDRNAVQRAAAKALAQFLSACRAAFRARSAVRVTKLAIL